MVPRHFRQGIYIINDCSIIWISFVIYQPTVRAKDALTAILCVQWGMSLSLRRGRICANMAECHRSPGGGGEAHGSRVNHHFSKIFGGTFGGYYPKKRVKLVVTTFRHKEWWFYGGLVGKGVFSVCLFLNFGEQHQEQRWRFYRRWCEKIMTPVNR